MSQVLFSQEQIAAQVRSLAQQIKDSSSDQDLVVLGIMNGACLFMADLLRELWSQGMTELQVDFISLSSYGSTMTSNGDPTFRSSLTVDVTGKDVLIVEDIVETGHSMTKLAAVLNDRGAKRVRTVVLLDKPGKRQVPFQPDFVGFTVEDSVWVEGYGLDTDHKGRGNPDIIAKEV